MKNPLKDKNFLRQLDLHHNHNIYAKIIVLDFNENPKEEITGRVLPGGSISVDGTSAVRRTCSLTLVAENLNRSNYIWGLNSKFKLEIGLENQINEEYPKVIWFKQGIFLITSFSTSTSLNNYTISIQGKDKMSLLNGDIGGVLTQLSTNFSSIDEVTYIGDTATTVEKKFPIKDIILNAVHEWAREPWHNIIVNDLDDYGLELLEYQGERPLYLFINNDTKDSSSGVREVKEMYFDGTVLVHFKDIPDTAFPIEDLEENGGKYDSLLDESSIGREFVQEVSKVCIQERENSPTYTVFKAEKGSVVGYRLTDITYPGDLILSVGSTLTQMLDKLVAVLGNFEYFYDIDGRFVFQKKKTYIDVNWNSINGEHSFSTETYAQNALQTSKEVYRFEDNYLVSSFQNSPNLLNLKNDFTIWGNQDVSGINVPIHIRYAIDHRPLMYRVIGYSELTDYVEEKKGLFYREYQYEGFSFPPTAPRGEQWTEEQAQRKKEDMITILKTSPAETYFLKTELGDYMEPDWSDPSLYSSNFNYYKRTYDKKEEKEYNLVFLSDPKVSYKQKTNDIVFVVDWREILYHMAMDYHAHNQESDFLKRVSDNNLQENGVSFYPLGYTGYEQYYIDFKTASAKKKISTKTDTGVIVNQSKSMSYWREVYNPCLKVKDHYISKMDKTWAGVYEYNSLGWRTDLQENPELVHFWFDFLDSYGEINKYSVQNIGVRSKAINDDKIKSIYYREIPNVIYRMSSESVTNLTNENWVKPGYVYLQVSEDKMGWFTMSAQGKSAIDVLREWLNDYTYCTESVSFSSTIPIYYLEPNTVAIIKDNDTGVSGQYIVKQFSIPLGVNGQMSITATKIVESSVSSLVGEENSLNTATIIDVNSSDDTLLEVQRPKLIVHTGYDEDGDFALYIDQEKVEKNVDLRVAVVEDGDDATLYIDNAFRGDVDKEQEIGLDQIIDDYFEKG